MRVRNPRRRRGPLVAAVGVVAGLVMFAAGALPSYAAKQDEQVTILMASTPDTLDPQATIEILTQIEADSQVYLNLVEFKVANGSAGYELVPAAAAAMPKISRDGKTYTFHLRKNIVYSDGSRMKASDFLYSAERALKLHWGNSFVITKHIVGGTQYAAGKASTISGIKANDRTGTITIHLLAAYGPFLDYLAIPGGLCIVPSGTPMKPMPSNPPIGAGPYTFANVNPNKGFTLVKNPHFAAMKIPNLPVGNIPTFNIQYVTNQSSEVEAVLANQADHFDATDTIPATLLPKIRAQASDRFRLVPTNSTSYFFLNVTVKPFNNLLARQAVNYAIDRRALSRLDAGLIKPSCYFLPIGLPGSPTGPCPYVAAGGGPKLAVAKRLVRKAGLVGFPVTVWGNPDSPVKLWTDYLASVLNTIGFKATEKLVAHSTYFSVIGTVRNHAQAGFNDFYLPPQPSIFYGLVFGPGSITPTNNNNVSMVSDPHINKVLAKLSSVPANQLQSVAKQWEALDRYESKMSYVIPFGETLFPEFFSTRIDPSSAVFNANFDQWASWKLK